MSLKQLFIAVFRSSALVRTPSLCFQSNWRHFISCLLYNFYTCHWASNLPTNAGDIRDTGSIPGLGRSPRGGHGNPFQYSCLENPMDRGAWWATVHRVAKSQTWLKQLHTHTHIHVINRRKFRGHPLFMSYLIYIVSYQQSLQFFLVCVATMLLPPVCCQNRSIMFSTALCDLDVD